MSEQNKKILIVGLGNPEEKYSKTRHNIGYMALNSLLMQLTADVSSYPIAPFYIGHHQPKFDGIIYNISSEDLYHLRDTFKVEKIEISLLWPTTGMNDSGISVSAHMKYLELEPKDVIVVHDDLDLDAGRIKIKQGGGSGGHNGLKSIDQYIGPDYHRIRVGISRPVRGSSILDYVLGDFTEEDKIWLENVKNSMLDNIKSIII